MATQLIGEQGINKLTIKSLANRMQFSEPALYRHFKGKEEIMASVLVYYRHDFINYMFPVLEKKMEGMLKLAALIKFQFDHFKQNPAVVMVIFSETSFQSSPLLSEIVLDIMNEKRSVLESILEHGQKDDSIRSDIDKEQLATVIMGSMRLKILQWRLSDFEFDIDVTGSSLWGAIKKLLK